MLSSRPAIWLLLPVLLGILSATMPGPFGVSTSGSICTTEDSQWDAAELPTRQLDSFEDEQDLQLDLDDDALPLVLRCVPFPAVGRHDIDTAWPLAASSPPDRLFRPPRARLG